MSRMSRRRFTTGMGSAALLLPQAASASAKQRLNLEEFRHRALEVGVRAAVVANSTEILLSEGPVSEPSRIASIRKSLMSALYGIAAFEGRVDLDATIGSFGIDDYQPLTALEKTATIRQLLQASSGIYIPSSAESPAMKAARPARGSHIPGSFWYYNNWDFNALGELYQRATGEDFFVGIEQRLAKPLGWRDFDPLKHAEWRYDPEHPRFPAYNLALSARDLARFGQLFLRRGEWAGKQIVPKAWVEASTRARMRTGQRGWGSGYGYLWWIASNIGGADTSELPVGAFTAAGNGGRYVTVFPRHDLVVAIQPDEKPGQPPVRLYADQPSAYTKLLRVLIG
jgi:CubicO group peptidase (beta-lactamase class C family)